MQIYPFRFFSFFSEQLGIVIDPSLLADKKALLVRDAFDLSQPCTEQMGLNHDVACSFERQLKNTSIRLVLFTSKAMTVTNLMG